MLKIIFVALFCAGQNSYKFSNQTFFTIILQYLPRFFYLVTFTYGSYLSILRISHLEMSRFIINSSIFLSVIAINILTIIESIVNSENIIKLKFEFSSIKEYLNKCLNIQYSNDFSKQFLFKTTLSLFFYAVALLSIYVLNGHIEPIDIVIFFTTNYKHLTLIHIALHVEYLQYIYYIVNSQFNVIQYENATKIIQTDVRDICYALKLFKFVHFKLWRIGELINKRFGILLIVLMIVYLLESSYSMYWIIVHFHSHNGNRTIRKYLNFVFILS